MIKIDMVAIQKKRDEADAALQQAIKSWNHAFGTHTGYAPALKSIATASGLYEYLRNWMDTTIAALQADPAVHDDNLWYPKLGGIRDYALKQRDMIAGIRANLLKNMAGYIKLGFSPADQASLATASPDAAAAAVDKKNAGANPNPNAQNPDQQSTDAPPVDVPPDAPSSPSWGLWAGLAAGGALLLKILKVW